LRDEIALLRDNQRNLADLLHDLLAEISTTTTATAGTSIELKNLNVFDGSAISNASTIEMFRSVREILTNILLHANASTIIISASSHDGLYELSITDDGCEFNLTKNIDHSTHHFGALGASERIDSIGGTLSYFRRESANITQIQIRP
jgi:two-component system sensor histidine kinase ComP